MSKVFSYLLVISISIMFIVYTGKFLYTELYLHNFDNERYIRIKEEEKLKTKAIEDAIEKEFPSIETLEKEEYVFYLDGKEVDINNLDIKKYDYSINKEKGCAYLSKKNPLWYYLIPFDIVFIIISILSLVFKEK